MNKYTYLRHHLECTHPKCLIPTSSFLFSPSTTFLLGVEKLITHLHKNHVPIAIATSSSTEAIHAKTKNLGYIFDLFDHITSGSSDPEVKRGKPAPDIFLVCASRFPEEPLPCEVIFDDSVT